MQTPDRIRGVRLNYEVLGSHTYAWHYGEESGPCLILVHGFRGDHHGLEPLAQQLVARAPELRVIVPDVPGFGESSPVPGREHDLDCFADWLVEFAEIVAPGAHAILGHSFGSLVVANARSRGLESVRTILVNPIASPALEGPQAFLTRLTSAYYGIADLLPERAARGVLGNRLIVRGMSEVMAKTHDTQLRAWIHDQHHRYFSEFSSTRTLLEAFHASISNTVTDFADGFSEQVLMIVGDRDDITPLSEQLSLRYRLSRARLVVMPGVGHLVHYEAVPEAAAEIIAFLRSGENT